MDTVIRTIGDWKLKININYEKLVEYKKQITIVAVVIFFLLACILMLVGNMKETSIEELGVQRVDISHTYYQPEDGIYQIYPMDISYLRVEDAGLRIEYLETQLKNADTYMHEDNRSYSEKASVTKIILLPLSKKFQAAVDTDINGKSKEIDSLIEEWLTIRENCFESPKLTSQYILKFEVKDLEITNMTIESFDVHKQKLSDTEESAQ